ERRDIIRQMGVDRRHELVRRQLGLAEEVSDLPERMHARIGPAGGVDADALLAGQRGDGGFERFLHGALAWLHLPAEEIRAVVAEGELEIAHEVALWDRTPVLSPGQNRSSIPR